jgi:carboxylesterase type B
VTLMGESAGAISICMHLTLPASIGLFSSAILESAICGFPFENTASAVETTHQLAETLGCKFDPTLFSRDEMQQLAETTPRIRQPAINHITPYEAQEDEEAPPSEVLDAAASGNTEISHSSVTKDVTPVRCFVAYLSLIQYFYPAEQRAAACSRRIMGHFVSTAGVAAVDRFRPGLGQRC